tara:strand:+ start:73 stop:912 length:840 start_codon:yes stop_codon:yes gene_type:complete
MDYLLKSGDETAQMMIESFGKMANSVKTAKSKTARKDRALLKRVTSSYRSKKGSFRLSPREKKVIDAFILQREGHGRLLMTDGRSLYKVGLGGEKVAVWRGPKIAITSTESVKSDETIIRYLVKKAGKGIVTFPYRRKGHKVSLRFESDGDAGPDGQYDGTITAFVPDSSEPVGVLSWSYWGGYGDGKGNFSVNMVSVNPKYRRSGIATALYKEWFRQERITKRDIRESYRTEDGAVFRSRARLATRFVTDDSGGLTCSVLKRTPSKLPWSVWGVKGLA